VFIQRELGFSGVPSFSIHATCLSFAVAFRQAVLLVESGAYRRILIVSAEQGSVCRDFSDPESASLIGDGAAAVIVEPGEGEGCSELLGFMMTTWPEGAELAEIRGCGTRRHPNNPATSRADNLFRMNGREIYRMTLRHFSSLLGDLLDRTGLRPEEIDLVVPHQPSGPAVEVLPKFGFQPDRIVNLVGRYGNCIAASMPMALAHAAGEGRLRSGDHVLLAGTSAGISVAGMVIRW
jgi:3-oxoacyl-[acyl-carrier-protein] synthase III